MPVEGNHPAYILYTSGTTGAPKGVVRPTAGHLVALNWTMRAIYNCGAGDVFWAASDVGWVVGHSYICYAPLIAGCTTVVYEGKPVGTPDAAAFWRVINEHKRAKLLHRPHRPARHQARRPGGQAGPARLPTLQALYLAGERADPDTIHWAQRHLKVPVIDHWWQTETGYAIAANPLGIEHLPVKIGSPSVPMPGYDVQVLDEGGHPVCPGTLGAIAIKLPLPPGTLPTLWNAEDRFRKSYLNHFPGYYETGDAGYIDADGYLYIMARTDDVINVAGHRLSTGAMEEVLAGHKDVAECAVIGVADDLKGQSPLGFLCLNKGSNRPHDEVVKECVAAGARPDRPRRRFQARRRGGPPAQDPVGQDPARHHGQDRRQPALEDARHHRRSRDPGRDHHGAADRSASPKARPTGQTRAIAAIFALCKILPASAIRSSTPTACDGLLDLVAPDRGAAAVSLSADDWTA